MRVPGVSLQKIRENFREELNERLDNIRAGNSRPTQNEQSQAQMWIKERLSGNPTFRDGVNVVRDISDNGDGGEKMMRLKQMNMRVCRM